jgi:hypothetical protein
VNRIVVLPFAVAVIVLQTAWHAGAQTGQSNPPDLNVHRDSAGQILVKSPKADPPKPAREHMVVSTSLAILRA